MNKKSIIIAVVVVIVLAVGGFFIFNNNKSTDNSATTSQPATSTSTTPNTSSNSNTSSDQNSATTITYSDSGFSPATLTVKADTTVTIKNNSSSNMQFDSDPHPVHTDDPELNVGVVAPGQSMTFKPDVVGTHGYHNHLNPTATGTLIVQ